VKAQQKKRKRIANRTKKGTAKKGTTTERPKKAQRGHSTGRDRNETKQARGATKEEKTQRAKEQAQTTSKPDVKRGERQRTRCLTTLGRKLRTQRARAGIDERRNNRKRVTREENRGG